MNSSEVFLYYCMANSAEQKKAYTVVESFDESSNFRNMRFGETNQTVSEVRRNRMACKGVPELKTFENL